MMTIGYILKVQVVFSALFLIYYAFLRKEKFLTLNRFVLIGILAIAFTLPVLQTPPTIESVGISRLRSNLLEKSLLPRFVLNDKAVPYAMHSVKVTQRIDYGLLALAGYVVVAAILLVVYLFDLYSVVAVIRKSKRHRSGAFTYCEPAVGASPFSFFRYIVVDKSAFSQEEYRNIILHECAHARHLHSLDVLLSDIACILFWVNPFIYLYRRQLKMNLEFLADDTALSSGIDARAYQMSLLQYSGVLAAFRQVNAFFTSKMKARIVMINTPRPGIRNSFKYLWLLPIGLILSALVGFRKNQPLVKPGYIVLDETVGGKSSVPVRQAVAEKGISYSNKKQAVPLTKMAKIQQENENVYIDARTDTVKFSLVPDSTGGRFQGIYVIADKIFTDDEIRAAIKQSGGLEMIFPARPVLGIFSANDSIAIKKWGKLAEAGVVFVKARSTIPVP